MSMSGAAIVEVSTEEFHGKDLKCTIVQKRSQTNVRNENCYYLDVLIARDHRVLSRFAIPVSETEYNAAWLGREIQFGTDGHPTK
jgi:hypothetical protein